MSSIIDAAQDGHIPNAEVTLVITNSDIKEGLERAQARGVKSACIKHKQKSREEYEQELTSCLLDSNIDLICLAGFMRILSPSFVKQFKNRILNVHPSLLPAFPGLSAQKRAIEYGVKYTGCTVHIVDEHLDKGPIISQSVVPILWDDTVDTLSDRILTEELKIYPISVALITSGLYEIRNRTVISRL